MEQCIFMQYKQKLREGTTEKVDRTILQGQL